MKKSEELAAEESQVDSSRKKMWRPLWLVLIIVVLVLVVVSVSRSGWGVGNSKWQALFLSNNQVYFGHIDRMGETIALSKIFYLRVNQQLQQGTPPTPTFDLVKLGTELHGPADRMYIPRSSVLFWEDMRADSQVVQGIEKVLNQNKK
ncbi:MAG: hypothetical protein HY093_00555 [Candidatus Liptonbacteria bacterium]|nr:hypothetical protein [Candidatus Liptonbacteria bacterium]